MKKENHLEFGIKAKTGELYLLTKKERMLSVTKWRREQNTQKKGVLTSIAR